MKENINNEIMTDLENIAIQIQDLINNQVLYKTLNDSKYKNLYKDCMNDLNQEIENTAELIIDYKENKLPISAVEAEGYLRGITTIYKRFKSWEE